MPAGFAQDSWRVRPNLTLNFGVRWDLMQYWSEKYNQIPAFILGQQSQVYPTAPTGLVYPTDPGVPNTLVPQKNRFAPRVWAWPIRLRKPAACWARSLAGPARPASAPATESSIP